MKQLCALFFSTTLCYLLLFTACQPTTQLQVLQPATFAFPEHIESIATVNRSVPDKKFGNLWEGLFSGESIGQDYDGARSAIEGLTRLLTTTPRFTVKHTELDLEGGNNIGRLPPPMAWSEVQRISQQYGTDAIAALEFFDSDMYNDMAISERTVKDKNGNDILITDYTAFLTANIRLGWRIYDPTNKQIIDEFFVEAAKEWQGDGSSTQNAIRNLPDVYRAVSETGFMAGEKYGQRIAPTWLTVRRSYFPKGHPKMEEANQLAKANNWQKAAAIWNALSEQGNDPKLQGQASYNMAVACEVEGKLELAHQWATKAFEEFENKKAKTYQRILEQRLWEQEQLRQQMK